jgi:hypothetical protein
LWFVHAFHRHLDEPLRPFVQQIVLPPLVAAVFAGVAAWWAAGSGSAALEAWTRPQALARLALGAAAFLAVVTAGHIFTRALVPADVRALFAVLRRPASAGGETA